MNIELVAQMFKNYQSNVLFHLEGESGGYNQIRHLLILSKFASNRQFEGSCMRGTRRGRG